MKSWDINMRLASKLHNDALRPHRYLVLNVLDVVTEK
jgi:hypothetical protein